MHFPDTPRTLPGGPFGGLPSHFLDTSLEHFLATRLLPPELGHDPHKIDAQTRLFRRLVEFEGTPQDANGAAAAAL